MIQKSYQMEKEVREKMRGGKGEVEITHVLKQNQITGRCRLVGKISLKPGCSIGLHPHDNEEEIFYIMKGKALVEDNGIKSELEAGDVILTGGGSAHSVENISSNEMLEIFAFILLF